MNEISAAILIITNNISCTVPECAPDIMNESYPSVLLIKNGMNEAQKNITELIK